MTAFFNLALVKLQASKFGTLGTAIVADLDMFCPLGTEIWFCLCNVEVKFDTRNQEPLGANCYDISILCFHVA